MTDNQNNIPQTENFEQEDINNNKTMAGLAYIIFFLPLIVCPQSAFARFHANQGLLLLILSVVGTTILGVIPIIGWMLIPIFCLAIFLLCIMGLVSGLQGNSKRLPLIGKYTILK